MLSMSVAHSDFIGKNLRMSYPVFLTKWNIANHFSKYRLLKKRHVLCFYLAVAFVVLPFCALMFLNKGNEEIVQDLGMQDLFELSNRLKAVESVSKTRMDDILALREHIGMVLKLRKSGGHSSPKQKDVYAKNASVYVGRETLWQKQNQAYQNYGQNEVLDLQLPSLKDYLPHINYFEGLQPSLKITSSRTGVSLVLGIPTVKRPVESYLVPTLQNLIDNMDDKAKEDTLIIVCIAETDKEYTDKQAYELKTKFKSSIDSGLLEVIAPPETYYPDFNNLRNTLGDPVERVRWRTKQNLDYAYLMMYARAKGAFYVQLEDDILTKPYYVTTMKNFAFKQLRENKDWIVLDFCQLGFIGKMFKSVDLSKLVAFFAIFHNDKPVDWLLDHLIQTKVCRFDRDKKDCKRQKDAVWIHYKPSLFQHVGTHSSLKGKVQKLKDRHFGKMATPYSHKNPVALLKTTLKSYKNYNLLRAYNGETFLWTRSPKRGDNITFTFSPPVLIERYYFRTGNTYHPEDILVNASVQVLPAFVPRIPDLIPYPGTADKYLVVGQFKETPGIAEGVVVPTVGPIAVLRIVMEDDSDHWLVLNEIVIETAPVGSLIASAFNISSGSYPTLLNSTELAT